MICNLSLALHPLAFCGLRAMVVIKDGVGVAWNGEMTGAVDVIPFEGNAGKLGAGPILSDGVMLFEDISQVVSVAFVNVFDAKIMNIKTHWMGRHL